MTGMAFGTGMGEHTGQALQRDAGQPLKRDVRSRLPERKSGILCRGQGQEIGMAVFLPVEGIGRALVTGNGRPRQGG
ncbi:MAG: hypothetical protein GY844_28330 [Bradyrhizobium sp.]|nr:hypothetical protein [Bradyrhizobium sp.]